MKNIDGNMQILIIDGLIGYDLSVCDLELSTNLYNRGIELGDDVANNQWGGDYIWKSITINDIVD